MKENMGKHVGSRILKASSLLMNLTLEFLLYLVSLPSVFSPIVLSSALCWVSRLYKESRRRGLLPYFVVGSFLLAPLLRCCKHIWPLPCPFPQAFGAQSYRGKPPLRNCQRFLGPHKHLPIHLFQSLYCCCHCCVVVVIAVNTAVSEVFSMLLKPVCPRISKFSKLATMCVSLLQFYNPSQYLHDGC